MRKNYNQVRKQREQARKVRKQEKEQRRSARQNAPGDGLPATTPEGGSVTTPDPSAPGTS